MWTRGIAGIVLSVTGAVWIAQGTDAIHGSGMSGHGQWAVIGVACLLVGLALLTWAWRFVGASRQPPED
jgi:protein-S-isoprenylcysteine O-methyltransferase Ste14